jgi:hypothetical protein
MMRKHSGVEIGSVRLGEMASDKPLVHLTMEPELIRRIDDFRYANRFPSRAAAIKFMLDEFLKAQALKK